MLFLCYSFELGFAGLKVYCNEENSRTFISLTVDPFTEKYLLAITRKVDQALEDFKLPTFYEVSTFFMSSRSLYMSHTECDWTHRELLGAIIVLFNEIRLRI